MNTLTKTTDTTVSYAYFLEVGDVVEITLVNNGKSASIFEKPEYAQGLYNSLLDMGFTIHEPEEQEEPMEHEEPVDSYDYDRYY